MIEVLEAATRYDSCLSCGSDDMLCDIRIRRSPDANGSLLTLCKGCIEELCRQAGSVCRG